MSQARPVLRPARDADREFLFALHRAAMRDAIERTWGIWDEPWQRAYFEARFDPEAEVKTQIWYTICGGRT